MTTLRVYDCESRALTVDLIDMLRLFAPHSLQTNWIVSPVKSLESGREWFEATGEGGEQLELLAEDNVRLSGTELAALAEITVQVIWGEFTGTKLTQPDEAWVVVRAIDSTFYEVVTDDETVLNKIKSTYNDVRV
ncbi:hypothetical protein EDF68_11720 [Ochrobactrum sp. BH3]|nr:hypothetical protein EDF68_11720 [Ochrobactrum sp. BH3]